MSAHTTKDGKGVSGSKGVEILDQNVKNRLLVTREDLAKSTCKCPSLSARGITGGETGMLKGSFLGYLHLHYS